jgi:hypothetical protein
VRLWARFRAADPQFAAEHPDIAWDLIYGMRNRLVHNYFEVDLEVVWRTVKQDLPPLRLRVFAALPDSATRLAVSIEVNCLFKRLGYASANTAPGFATNVGCHFIKLRAKRILKQGYVDSNSPRNPPPILRPPRR